MCTTDFYSGKSRPSYSSVTIKNSHLWSMKFARSDYTSPRYPRPRTCLGIFSLLPGGCERVSATRAIFIREGQNNWLLICLPLEYIFFLFIDSLSVLRYQLLLSSQIVQRRGNEITMYQGASLCIIFIKLWKQMKYLRVCFVPGGEWTEK